MGKLVVQYFIPVTILLVVAVVALKWWWLKFFPKQLKGYKDMQRATDRYDEEIYK